MSLQAVDLFVRCTWDLSAQRWLLYLRPGKPPPASGVCVQYNLYIVPFRTLNEDIVTTPGNEA